MHLRICNFCIIFLISYLGYSQSYRNTKIIKFKGLSTGYNYSFDGKDKPKYHLLDLNLNYGTGTAIGGFLYGFGSEVALNTDNFVIGPKISGFIFFGGLAFGSELIAYTDFDNWTLRQTFAVGIGFPNARLTFNPQLILANENFRPIHRGYINFTWNFFLEKEEKD